MKFKFNTNIMKKIIASIILTVGLVISTAMLLRNGVSATGSEVDVYGVLKSDSNGDWYYVNDGTHVPSGISSVSQTSTYIIVNQSVTFDEIHFSIVDEDETYARYGYECGASQGFDKIYIYCSEDGVPVDPADMYYYGGNLWIYARGTY